MARAKKQNVNNTINIKSLPVQCHIGASKFVNDDWGTMAFSIQRNQIQNKFADPELRYNFIYFLFGYENSKEVVYVGQAKKRNNGESVLKRLREHDTSTTEKYRDKWAWIVAVTNKNDAWGLDDLNALEHAFYNEIPADQNLNGNNPNSGGADYEAYADKISQIKSLITAVGFSIFSDEETTEKIQVTSETNDYSIVEDLQNGMARIPEIVTPQKVVKAMVDMLPAEVWNSKTKFLDPACKGGEYLREVYDRLMETEILQLEFPNAIERSNHILKNQIYGIALSQVSLERTTKKLLGEDRNIRVIADYINKLKGNNMGSRPDGSQQNIMDILNKEFGKDMKFDVVIGNPPYQENTGGEGKQSKTLYDKFILNGIKLTSRLVVMITNNTFLTNDAKMELRDEMIRAGLCRLDNYPLSGDVFKGVGVACCIFVLDKTNDGSFMYHRIEGKEVKNKYTTTITVGDIIPESQFELSIPKKIIINKSIADILLGEKAFGLSTKGRKGFIGGEEIINSSPIYFEGAIKLLHNFNGAEDVCYVNMSDIPRGTEYIKDYKVICPRIITKQSVNALNKVRVIEPNVICTQHWSTIGVFDNKIYADNLSKYISTKLFQFLAYTFSSNGVTGLNTTLLKHVPLQDFTSTSDIDWSQSIADIDQQLYKKYNLTEEEIAYIEQTIKPMA